MSSQMSATVLGVGGFLPSYATTTSSTGLVTSTGLVSSCGAAGYDGSSSSLAGVEIPSIPFASFFRTADRCLSERPESDPAVLGGLLVSASEAESSSEMSLSTSLADISGTLGRTGLSTDSGSGVRERTAGADMVNQGRGAGRGGLRGVA